MNDSNHIPIIACRPVNWPTSGPLAGAPETPIYPGVDIQVCDACKVRVYVGPKQQEMQESNPHIETQCFECVLKVAIANENNFDIFNLGNPFKGGG